MNSSYIISAPDVKLAYDRALQMAAELTGNPRKVYADTHPDVITVRKDKTELTVDKVRDIISDSVILPNESEYKVYIFYDGKDMNPSAQNAALKLLEEPPKSVVIILLSDHPSRFLPTIRSRCTEININASADVQEEPAETEFALGLIHAYASKKPLSLYRFCEQNNKMTIAELRESLRTVKECIAGILAGRRLLPGIDPQCLLALDSLMDQCLKYLGANVNVKQIMGMIEISI